MKRIIKVVITGGPCAGKTTALAMLDDELSKRGESVVICEETATYFIKAGLKPFGDEKSKLALKDFQGMILKGQLTKEDLCLEGAEMIPNEKVTVLFDRGALDNRAYLEDEEFDELMEEAGVTEEELLGRYHIVIHFVSTAIDKEKYYKKTKERTESPEKARYLDYKTAKTWRNHPYHIFIFNDGTMEEKVQEAVEAILQRIEELEKEEKEKVYKKAI